jgi:hypothetical protein
MTVIKGELSNYPDHCFCFTRAPKIDQSLFADSTSPPREIDRATPKRNRIVQIILPDTRCLQERTTGSLAIMHEIGIILNTYSSAL